MVTKYKFSSFYPCDFCLFATNINQCTDQFFIYSILNIEVHSLNDVDFTFGKKGLTDLIFQRRPFIIADTLY